MSKSTTIIHNKMGEFGPVQTGYDVITEHQCAQCDELDAKLKIAEDALEFYADNAWIKTDHAICNEVGENDLSRRSLKHKLSGGKLARETLAKMKEVENV